MKNDPCIRLGMRISPKMRENPADSRNSRPPKAMLFTARVSQRVIYGALRESRPGGGSPHPDPLPARAGRGRRNRRSRLEILCRWIIAGIDRVGQECLLVIGPELA